MANTMTSVKMHMICLLSKQSWGWWFETIYITQPFIQVQIKESSASLAFVSDLRRHDAHYDVTVMDIEYSVSPY